MKYSKSKIIKAVAVVVLLVTVFLSLSKFHDTRCNVVSITIKDSADVKFVDVNDVRTMLNSVMGEIEGHTMDSINAYLFDEQLRKCPYIRNVSIYKSIRAYSISTYSSASRCYWWSTTSKTTISTVTG